MYRLRLPSAAKASMRAWTGALPAVELCIMRHLQWDSVGLSGCSSVPVLLSHLCYAYAHCKGSCSAHKGICSSSSMAAAIQCPLRGLMHVHAYRLSGALVSMQRSGQLTSVTAANR